MDPVHDQYENFPYPKRDPADEDKRLVIGSPSGRDELNHFLYGGERDWSQPFRALIAGGGTGDALIMLAQQLADEGCPGEIVYLDLSAASRAIAEARAARRGLTTISFETGSLMDAGAHGTFDYIDCCGVLHHLADPLAGLHALKGALKPGGGMGLMLYGELGRTGVYDAQDMLRTLTKQGDANKERVDIAKRLMASLPDTNRLRRNPFVSDYKTGDEGLYDLLLHSRDRAYRVPEIYALLEEAGLDMVGFVAPSNYDPDFFITDAKLKGRLARLDQPVREAFAELLAGNIKRHQFYCAPKGTGGRGRIAKFAPGLVPVIYSISSDQLLAMIQKEGQLTGRREGLKFEVALPPRAKEILALCDGKHSFNDIRSALSPRPAADEFLKAAERLYHVLNGANLMLLKRGD